VPSFAATQPKAIVLVARNGDKLRQLAEFVAKSHPSIETLSIPTDISDSSSVAALFEKVKAKYGHADVLVNNAGVFEAIAPVRDVDSIAWWEELVHLLPLNLLPHSLIILLIRK
jgi:NAD(P)-dependent dehydrogenase (short-subunit alcohol dehydrogenase family)